AWRIVGMCLLTPNLMDVLPAEATAQFEPIMNGLADLEADMDEVYATGGLDELLDLCDEEAIFVTDTDMDGSAEVITAGALGDMIMGAGPIPLRQPEGAERVTLTGLGGAVLMTDATVATDMGTLLFRHVLIGVYKPEVDVWKIVLAVGAPLEE
ncbi:MAG TPA: hypothetical protein QGH10_16905, partial [Armatimonadota bacterium]|nr:hypothetical protein [Armatimonadota bacterium]